MQKDYYKTLGIDKKASKEEIKKAFHVLAHKYHPDKNKGDDKKFKEVNEAYQVLSNDQKRSQYDQFGSADGPQGFGGGGFSGFSKQWGFGGNNGGVEFDMGDLGDIFGEFFGGGMGRRQKVRRGRDISTEIDILFEDSIFGVKKNIIINKQSTCDVCQGSGALPGSKLETCKTCNGQGNIREVKRSILGSFSSTRVCDICFGSGKIPSMKCNSCHGSGVKKKDEDININIPAGINNGEMLRMTAMGEAISGGQPGDLYIKINVKPHAIYKREGFNLRTDINIKLTEALLGRIYKLKLLEGDVIEVKIPEGTNHGNLLRIKEKGVPQGRNRGDIIIKVLVNMPNKLSRKAKEAIEKLREEGI
jgi:molecular chaperone DnaJ